VDFRRAAVSVPLVADCRADGDGVRTHVLHRQPRRAWHRCAKAREEDLLRRAGSRFTPEAAPRSSWLLCSWTGSARAARGTRFWRTRGAGPADARDTLLRLHAPFALPRAANNSSAPCGRISGPASCPSSCVSSNREEIRGLELAPAPSMRATVPDRLLTGASESLGKRLVAASRDWRGARVLCEGQ
jgi:hypothetical protein